MPGVEGDVPLVAFGQTPFWDEPMKAILAAESDRPMIIGVHDLDYFSRTRGVVPGAEWQIVPHNDNSFQDAWIAAGEVSALFGSEAGPTRQALSEAGVSLNSLLPTQPAARQKMLNRVTESWGWRGLLHNVEPPRVICETSASDAVPHLKELLEWGARRSASCLAGKGSRKPVTRRLRQITDFMDRYVAEHPNATLSDLYRALFDEMYGSLIGELPSSVEPAGTRDFFRFNRRTAGRDRFRPLACFLGDRSGDVCRTAYNAAVAESGIKSLDESEEGALPFDVYVPGRGRGTLLVARESVRVDLPGSETIRTERRVRSVRALAEALEERFGEDVSLLGKAVTLPVMFACEAIMVVHETASAYIPRTRRMLTHMAAKGVHLELHPLLRVRLRTWDSLSACDARFRLPAHLARAFDAPTISADGFARRWKHVVREQARLLKRLGNMLSPCDFVEYLGHEEHNVWFDRLEKCLDANRIILDVQRQVADLRHRFNRLRIEEDDLKEEAKRLERRRGDYNRDTLRPIKRKLDTLPDDAPAAERKRLEKEYQRAAKEGEAILMALEAKRDERRRAAEERKRLGRKIRSIERSRKATAARRIHRNVIRQGERARLDIARSALLTVEGLRRSDARPSAWWFHAVDPSGRWFERVRKTARYRIEPLVEEPA